MNSMQIFLLLWLHTSIAILFAQAPGDEDAFCTTVHPIISPPPPYSPLNSMILMDSFNYVTLLSEYFEESSSVWQQVNVNIENSNATEFYGWYPAVVSACRQALFTCPNDPDHNNWLITQHISRSINGTLLPQVTVLIHIRMTECFYEDCQVALSLSVWETSTIDRNAARTITNYRIIQLIPPVQDRSSFYNGAVFTIPVIFRTNATGFYLALVDNDVCLDLDRIVVYYDVPPEDNEMSGMEIIIISVITVATLLGILTVIVIVCFYHFKKIHKRKNDVSTTLAARRPISPTIYVEPPKETAMMTLPSLIGTLPKSLIIDHDRIQIGKIIGQGEFGVVYKACMTSHMAGDIAVAIKTLKGIFATAKDIENLSQEIYKMVHFDHPNVMSLIGVCTVPSNDNNVATGPCVVMPFMDRGSLLDQLRQNSDQIIIKGQDGHQISMVKNNLIQMCLQIAKGMEYLTNLRFLHRDLAARNCLVDINGLIKVSDFGLAEDLYSQSYFRQAKGNAKLPIKWMSSESITHGKFSEKTDVWSYGVTCWEIFTGGMIPYPGIHPQKLVEYLEGGERLEKPRNEACDSDIFSMMQSCWQHKDTARPTFSEIVILLEKLLECNADYLDLTGVNTEPQPSDTPYENTDP